MKRFGKIALTALLLSAFAGAQVSIDSTRQTSHDYYCLNGEGVVLSGHQRYDKAQAACATRKLNNPNGVYEVQGGRWRIVFSEALASLVVTSGPTNPPEAGGGGGDLTATTTNNYLTIDSAEGGSAELQVRWEPSYFNTDATLGDIKTYKVQVGSSTGNYDIGSVTLTSTTLEATVIATIDNLVASTTYFIGVSQINSADVESAVTEASGVAAVPAALCSTWDEYISTTTTINSGGCYRVTSSFSGSITIASADNVELNGQANTLTHSGNGLILSGDLDNVYVHNLAFNNTGGSGDHNIDVTGLSGTPSGITLTNLTLECPAAGAAAIFGNQISQEDLSDFGIGLIHNNTVAITGDSGVARTCMFVKSARNFIAWNNTITATNVGRDGGYAGISQAYLIGDTFLGTGSGSNQVTYISNRNSTSGIYVAHGDLKYDTTLTGAGLSHRLILFDGDENCAVLRTLFTLDNPGGTGRGVRVRATSGATQDNSDIMIGYNTFDLNNDGGNFGIAPGGTEDAATDPGTDVVHIYHNNFVDSNVGVEWYDEWLGPLETWGNTGIGDMVLNGTTGSLGDWNSNNDSGWGTVSTRSGMSGDVWNSFNSYALVDAETPKDHITIQGSWTGYDPTTKTPNAPVSVDILP